MWRLTGDRRINGRLTIEIGQLRPCKISLKEALESQEFTDTDAALAIPVGLDVDGSLLWLTFTNCPHVMVGGQTGSGKSQFTENILSPSLLMRHSAESLKLLLIDPKMIQFTVYNGLPHLLRPVIVDADESKKAFTWLLGEMDERFDMLSKSRNQTIDIYNAKSTDKMPYIVVVIDEVADLMMVDSDWMSRFCINSPKRKGCRNTFVYRHKSTNDEEVHLETLRANLFLGLRLQLPVILTVKI